MFEGFYNEWWTKKTSSSVLEIRDKHINRMKKSVAAEQIRRMNSATTTVFTSQTQTWVRMKMTGNVLTTTESKRINLSTITTALETPWLNPSHSFCFLTCFILTVVQLSIQNICTNLCKIDCGWLFSSNSNIYT